MPGRNFLRIVSGGGNIGSIDPASLTGNEVYLRSDQVAGVEGDPVGNWPDISGNARNAIQGGAQRPILRTTTLLSPNGTRLIDFDVHAKEMHGALPVIPIDNTKGFTWYFFFRQNVVEASEAFFGQFLGGCPFSNYTEIFARGSAGFGYPNNTDTGAGSNQAGGFHVSSGSPLQTGFQSVILVQTPPDGAGSKAQLYKNGAAIGLPFPWHSTPNSGYDVAGTSGNAGLLGGLGLWLLRSNADGFVLRNGIRNFFVNFFGGG